MMNPFRGVISRPKAPQAKSQHLSTLRGQLPNSTGARSGCDAHTVPHAAQRVRQMQWPGTAHGHTALYIFRQEQKMVGLGLL